MPNSSRIQNLVNNAQRYYSGVLFFCLVFSFNQVFGGNTCATATAITPNGACDGTQVNAASTGTAHSCAGTLASEEWWSFSAVSGQLYTITYTTSSSDNPAITVYSGACGGLTEVACTNATGNGNPVTETYTFTSGVTGTLFIKMINFNAGNMSGNLCVTNPPTNDDPNNATPITAGSICNYTTYTNAFATASTCGTIGAPGCAGYAGGDVWFSIVVPASGRLFLTSLTGVMTDGGMAAYSGTPCGTLTLISCDNDNGAGTMPQLNLTGLTAGNTIYIRFWENGNNNNGTFDLCVMNPCPSGGAPTNDECASATALTFYTSSCTQTGAGLACATGSAQGNTCADTDDDDDIWFSFVPSTTSANVSITSVVGTATDLYHVVYSGACGSLTQLTCSDANSSNTAGLTIGNTYFIRVYTNSNTAQTVNFGICVTGIDVCGNPMNNDFCEHPATLTFDASQDFSASTASSYTADAPGNLNAEFCGTVHNNSWYEFVATSTNHSFVITSVTGCTADGIQAEVYEITYDVNGCCSAFNSVSTCFNPGSVSTGSVDAAGLTVGNTYALMFDGYSGANCNYTVSGWSASGVLPIELIDFYGKNLGEGNQLTWRTLSEINNDLFLIERSTDGINFGSIASVDGHGTTSLPQDYEYYDQFNSEGKNTYYRLKQIDTDGHSSTSNTIVVYPKNNVPVYVFPNPAQSELFLEFYADQKGRYQLVFSDLVGKSKTELLFIEQGAIKKSSDVFTSLGRGTYVLTIFDPNNQLIRTEKIVKL